MPNLGASPATGNALLAALPGRERDLLDAELLHLDKDRVIAEPNRNMQSVYYPLNCVISVITELSSGETVESQTIGRDGFAGASVYLGGPNQRTRVMVQVPGSAMRVSSEAFRKALPEAPTLNRLTASYLNYKFGQLAQLTACMAAHPAHERCARWMLMLQDAVGQDFFPLTQEFMAQMLGVHRPTVSLAEGSLQANGLIRRERGKVTILDRSGLEAASCECYEAACRPFVPAAG